MTILSLKSTQSKMKDPLQGSFSFWYCLYRVVLAVVFLCCGCCCCHSHTQNFVSCVAPPYVHMSVEWTDLCIFPSTFLNFFFFLLSIKWRHTWFFFFMFLDCFSIWIARLFFIAGDGNLTSCVWGKKNGRLSLDYRYPLIPQPRSASSFFLLFSGSGRRKSFNR
jgi:hypothetical protein